MFTLTNFLILVIKLLILVNLSSSNQIQRSIVNKRTNHTNLFSLKDHFKSCDSLIKNKRYGFITSPFFPNEFPLPIYCKYVIDLSTTFKNDNQTLVVYLNEVYLKQGLKFSEYSFFLDENLNIDKSELAIINFNSSYSFITTKKKYLVIRFQIDDRINHNLNARILNSPANLNGFNLTFELLNKTLSNHQEHQACSFKKCNFNGRCLSRLERNSFKFNCECFENYHGDNCEFGPHCDPFKLNHNVNSCLNGGSCIYSNELVRIKCKCADNYSGEYCEKPQFNSQFNVTENSVYIIKVKAYNYDQQRINEFDKFEIRFKQMITSILRQYDRNLHLQEIKFNLNNIIEIHLFYQIDNDEFVRKIFVNEISKGSLGRFILDKNYLDVKSKSAFTITELSILNSTQLNEGDEIVISCFIKGITTPINITWFKDEELINLDTKFRSLKHKTSFLNNYLMKSTLAISNSVYLDSGSFTCAISSNGYELKKSTNLQLNKLQQPILGELSINANAKDNITIDCYTNAKDYNLNLLFGYNWIKNGQLVNQLNGKEIVQDLYPTGSRITILNVTKPLKYKCILTSLIGTSSKEIFVDVIDQSLSEDNYCKTEFKDGIEWRQSIKNTEFKQKCPDNYVGGEVKRKCIYLDEDKPMWSQIDYTNCLSIELDRLFRKFKKYFLGYGNENYEQLIDELNAKIKAYKFKNGEGESVVRFLAENNQNLIDSKIYFNQDNYQKILIKLLNLFDYLIESHDIIYNLEAKDQFQNLLFNLSGQIKISKRDESLFEELNFKNFDLFIFQKLTKNRSQLQMPFASSAFNLYNLHLNDKMIFIFYKTNHFLLKKDIFNQHHPFNDPVQNSKLPGNYLAFQFFGIKKLNDSDTTVLEINFNEKFLNCQFVKFDNGKFVSNSHECNFKFVYNTNSYRPSIISFDKLRSKPSISQNELTFLKGNNKIIFNIITCISCSIILIAMILNLKNWRMNNCLIGILKMQLCVSLIINHFSTAMALLSSNQKNENYWLLLFTISQISALIHQFCICIAIEHTFDGSKSHFTRIISYRITIVSTIVPFSIIGLIYEFYYTSYSKFLWNLEAGSYLFYGIISASILITLGNLFLYIKLNTKRLQKNSNLILKSNKYEDANKILTQTIIITILLNIHLAFVLLIINMPANAQNLLIFGYGISSLMIVFIVLILSFKTRKSEYKTSAKRCNVENLSLNRQRKMFRHHYNTSNTNANPLYNSEIQSIYN